MNYAGIDMHTRNMAIAVLNDNGELLALEKIDCCEKELEKFFNELKEPVQAVVEATSNWYWFSDWCTQQGIQLTLAHSKMLKAISYAKVKTDSVDARTLAELLRVDLIPKASKIPRHQRDLRELTRTRLRLVAQRTRIQNQVKATCKRYNADLKKAGWYDLSHIEAILKDQLPVEAMLEISVYLKQIRLTQEQIQRIEEGIEKSVWFNESVQRLREVPGIGKVVAWTIVSEIGDVKRFPTDRQFASYCRLATGSKDSGDNRRHKSGCKDGNRYLKLAFMHAAVSAIQKCGPVRKYYNKIKRRSGQKTARAVVAKHLSRIVWHMLVKNEPFKKFKGQICNVSKYSGWPRPVNPHNWTGT